MAQYVSDYLESDLVAVDWFVKVQHLSSGVHVAAPISVCLFLGLGIHLV